MKLLKTFTFLPLLCFGVGATEHHGTIELSLMNSVGSIHGDHYYANVTVGTPGQSQTVMIDTGSGTTIFAASNASFCTNSTLCPSTLNATQSSTLEVAYPGGLDSNYGDGTHLGGDLITDVVQISNLMISNVSMGLAHDIRWNYMPPVSGIMGLGYSNLNAVPMKMWNEVRQNPSFVETLVKAKAISSRLFSIYLNTPDLYGSILFGGIDNAKYNGPLTTLNCLNYPDHAIDSWYLKLQEVTMKPYDGPNQTLLRSTTLDPWVAIPDTGCAVWHLPTSAYHKVVGYAGVNPMTIAHERGFVRPCREVAYGNANATRFQIVFAGNGTNTASLDFELADIFAPLTQENGSMIADRYGQPLCRLQIIEVPEYQRVSLISNDVMRAGYWVFDLDNGQISLGQSNLRANISKVVRVQAGTNGLTQAIENLVFETQANKVDRMSGSTTHKLSTATNTIGYTTGAQFYTTSIVAHSSKSAPRLETQRRLTK
ncbi:acid protease [Aureobasidium pullulans]|uniref:Acid protease n=1 Tax=Aureobasidium pullulans TaxID=5580 RepID=A0A4V4JQS4_AURPU|nr:acid protease [Aureobasidium pullulans]THY07183.1 acid protease [Aureobasidium pullulans]